MNLKKFLTVAVSCFMLFSVSGLTAFADVKLPDGAVKGLPENLTAMDSEGNVVSSDTGEYFFHVENMKYGETYTKDIQLMNLRDDKSYHIYFYVEPLFKKGNIDLEDGCDCTFWLDGEKVFNGKVTGEPEGNYINLRNEVLDCGLYNPGDYHQLKCSVVWNDLDVLVGVDNGHRLVDIDGEHVLVGPDDSGHADGEIEFKWIFYAAVDENYVPPDTGLFQVNKLFWLICCIIMLLLVAIMLFLLNRKKKKKENKNITVQNT